MVAGRVRLLPGALHNKGEIMQRKYELTDEMIEYNGFTLHRIKAVRDFSDVEAGDLGGFVQGEYNLNHVGNAWVSGDAKVYDCAVVCGDAKVYDNAVVYDDAEVSDDAKVYDNAMVYGNAEVYGNSEVYDDAQVFGSAEVCGNTVVRCGARVYGNEYLTGNDDVID